MTVSTVWNKSFQAELNLVVHKPFWILPIIKGLNFYSAFFHYHGIIGVLLKSFMF